MFAIVAAFLYNIPNIAGLYSARLIGGTVAGINVVGGSVFLAEIFPEDISSIGGIFIYAGIAISLLVGSCQQFILGSDFMAEYWRVFLLWPTIISIARIILIMALIKTDTPKFYLMNKYEFMDKKREQLALKYRLETCLSYLYEESEVGDKADTLIADNLIQKKQTTFLELFSKKYLYRTVVGSFLNAAQQFSGINFLIFFSTDLFNNLSGNGDLITLVIGFSNFFGCFFAIYAVEKFGKKFNFITGIILQFIAFCCLTWGVMNKGSLIPTISIVVYMLGYSMGLGATLVPYCAEILPPVGAGFVNAVQWVSAAIIGKMVPILTKK